MRRHAGPCPLSVALETSGQLRLAADGWVVDLAPSRGALLSCSYEDVEILRPTPLHLRGRGSPFGYSYFPLAPYSNRIQDGAFEFGGKKIRIAPNADEQRHPLHGVAWLGEWTAIHRSRDQAAMVFKNTPSQNWPWAFKLHQSVKLHGPSLKIDLRMANLSPSPMPAGLGFHPYFSNPGDAQLMFNATGVWMSDEAGLPTDHRAATGGWDYSQGRTLNKPDIDNCFTGWDRKARISWRRRPFAVEINASEPLTYAVVYVSQEMDCFCFEPVSHMNNALSWRGRVEETGLQTLAPGKECSATMELRLFAT